VAFLRRVEDDNFLDALPTLPGGHESRRAIDAWLEKYGMRGVGEIDLTRPRWSERPTALVPLILGNIRNFAPGEAERRFTHGLDAARKKEMELLQQVRLLPGGDEKAREVTRMIDRVRTFVGYREYPKYFIVNRYFAYKQALMTEADRLVESNLLRDREDVFFLTFLEFRDVVRTNVVDYDLIRERKEVFRVYQRLTPPRVFTSDGEIVTGAYHRDDVPPGALVGLPVSAGTFEGRARVVFDPAKADFEPGDILVTPYTDPSWTPLFVAINGLVTEVGGLMTHGAVIAREYGLPAVVGVEHATERIRDGQRIRVHGTAGYVEILS
jgi:pyruvate,water dikinase